MTSDQDEKRTTWPEAGAMNWDVPVNVASQAEEDDTFPGEIADADGLLTPETENDLTSWSRQPLINKETLKTFARQFSPVLIPLFCALIVFLVTLPASRQGLPAHPPVLVAALLMLALAILQGMLLYFAGSNDTLWLVWFACGCALFVIGGVFVAFGAVAALVVLGIVLVLSAVLLQRCIYTTREGFVDLVGAFGKYAHPLYPGLNLLLPWEEVMVRLDVQEMNWSCPPQRVPTSRDQDVELTATLSYQLVPEDAYLAALTIKDWQQSLHTFFVGTIQSLVNELGPGDFIAWTQSGYSRSTSDLSAFNPVATTRWDRINAALCGRMQDQAAMWGIQVNWVRIQDITVLPHAFGSPTRLLGHDDTTELNMVQPTPGELVSTQQGVSAPVPPMAAPPSPRPKPEPLRNVAQLDTLRSTYDAVRRGKITDPTTILELAERFESVAADPVASKKIDFDAVRGAMMLRQRAQKLQESPQKQVPEGSLVEKG